MWEGSESPRATQPAGDGAALLRFGGFELDLGRQELRRGGALVKLQAQPFKVLALLAGRTGELIERDEIRRHVWGGDTFVDYEQGINVCVRQIRQALGDSAGSPRFVETVPRRGYRFLAPVERPRRDAVKRPATRHRRRWVLAAAVLAAASSALTVSTLVSGRDRSAVEPAARRATAVPRPAERAAAGVLVVLPFATYSAGEDDDYLGDGMTEELITEISRRLGGRLGVIARTTAMKYKRSALSAGEIAAELGADYVLEGSVRRHQDRLRVTAQLIRAGDELHLWAGNYDRALADVIALESEVSGKIGQALALELDLEPPGEPPGMAATDAATYDAYLRGRHELARRDADGFTPRDAVAQARAHLERATDLDPGFAPAWVELGGVYRISLPAPEGARRAREAFERALALDDASPRAHRALALLRFYYDWDLEGARASFDRALALDPGFAEAHHDVAAYYSATSRHEQALASVKRALALDPLSPGVASDVGWYHYFGRRFAEAVEHSRHTLEIEPGYFWAKRCIVLAAVAGGDFETAAAQALDNMRQAGATAEELRAVESAEPRDAAEAYWSWRLERVVAAAGDRQPPAAAVATLHMALGDGQAALEALEQAHRQRRGWILPFLGVHPLFDPLRAEPRFQALVADIRGEMG